MGRVFQTFQAQETFEVASARAEGREPNIYHGVFSSHPAPDERTVQAAKVAAQLPDAPPGGYVVNRNVYMQAIDGMAFGTSKAQASSRDNRFYHYGLGITLAFPRGWNIQNQRDTLLAFTPNKESVMQISVAGRPDRKSPQEFLIEKLKGKTLVGGESLTINGMQGYSLLTRDGSPLDNAWVRCAGLPSTGATACSCSAAPAARRAMAGRKPTDCSSRWPPPCAI